MMPEIPDSVSLGQNPGILFFKSSPGDSNMQPRLRIIAFERIQSCLAGVLGWIGLEKMSHHYLRLWMFFSAAWDPLAFLWLWILIEWIQTSWTQQFQMAVFLMEFFCCDQEHRNVLRESTSPLADNTTKSRVSLSQLSFTWISIRS